MDCLNDNKNIITNIFTFNKTLFMTCELGNMNFDIVCKNLGEDFIDDIAQGYSSDVLNLTTS